MREVGKTRIGASFLHRRLFMVTKGGPNPGFQRGTDVQLTEAEPFSPAFAWSNEFTLLGENPERRSIS